MNTADVNNIEESTIGDSNPYFAAIDLGSNSFHLLVVKINDGVIEKIDRVKEMVQIAKGLTASNQLSQAAQERALHCLRCFHERIQDIPPAQVRIAGTKALRSASNASSFLKQAEEALGHSIDIISGYEEARLVYLGVSHDISADKGRSLVIDIGGGSTEFVIGEQRQPRLLESLPVGCVTYSDEFFNDDNNTPPSTITSEMIWKTYYATSIELESICQRYQRFGWDIAVGSSGTMRAIAQLMQGDVVNGVITKDGLSLLLNQLHTQGVIENTDGLSKERCNTLPAGIVILSAIFDQLGLDEVHVVDSALKEGLIFDTLGRLSSQKNHPSNADIRDQTVNKMMEQYQVDKDQAQRANLALSHFVTQLPEPVVNGVNVKDILQWAAQLHEIGLTISHSGHHRHSYYLLKESDMAGFSRFEQELLALLVGAHRRKIKADKVALLTGNNQQALHPSLVCLRLAILLNQRRENDIELPDIAFTFVKTLNIEDERNDGNKIGNKEVATNELHINLRFPDDWLDNHPLTFHNLSREKNHLSLLNVILQFT
jgi:exopolyphosphatase/guanosine-5'-triphosphate,3'-diphosphate pyrophosphatase